MGKAAVYKRNTEVYEDADPYGVTRKIDNGLKVANDAVGTVIDTAGTVTMSLASVLSYLITNWQVTLIGAVAILLLIKRL